MDKPIFDYEDYKAYLNDRLAPSGEGRGARTRLAEELGCQPAFVSKVLNGAAHFSLEHAIRISRFIGHNQEEETFFLHLVNLGRAGSKLLEDHYRSLVAVILEKRKDIRDRVKAKETLSGKDQVLYYSSWIYGAIHVLVSIPEFRTKTALARKLSLSLQEVGEALDFLVSTGILLFKDGLYSVGHARLHLGKTSPLVNKHHTNWRIQAINALDRKHSGKLHYAAAIAVSRADAERIREVLLGAIERSEAILRPSKEEAAYCLVMDYFEL